MKRSLILIAVLLPVMVSCATAPASYQFDPVANINGAYDDVWAAVVEYFAVGSLPIDVIEKDSGLLVTDWMDASSGYSQDKICDCGSAGISTVNWQRGKFSVFIKKISDTSTDLRVTCTYQQRRSFGGASATVNCNSTGTLARIIHEDHANACFSV